ncbi:isochorismatase family protein, partial [Raoultella planticola]|uniref:isochorismatase family protein n=1 Tax=Raoultella planticola TaxID=575 RepID=UPI003D034D3E
VGKTLLHGDVLMWLMKTLLTSGCTNQRGAGHSCFRDTELQLQLSLRGVKQLVIAGMKTEFCVDTTCRAAPEHGFRTVLISDAHTTMDNKYLSASEIIAHHNVTLAGPFVTLATAACWSFHSEK